MIKFFRKIRQQLLTENKLSKYLLYAIGEIILVIIGILIALQINNWKDKRIEIRELEVALHAMIDELDQNIQFLEQEKADKEKRLLPLDNMKGGAGSDQELGQIVFAFGDEVKSKEFNTIYLSLKEEKKIRLIQSPELRNQMTTFYEYELASIRDANIWHKKFVSENIDPFILENLPINDNHEADIKVVKELLNQPKFKNILTYQKMIYKGYLSTNEMVTQLAVDLKSTISSYLNK